MSQILEVPENEQVLMDHLGFKIVLKDNTTVQFALNKELTVNGKRYYMDKDIVD